MKKLMIIMALAALTATAGAQENDTVVIHNPKKVTIITGDSLQRIIVSGKEGDDKFTYQNTIRLVDSNYVSTTRIGRDRWELIPSVKVGKKKDDVEGHSYDNEISAHFGIGFTAPTKADARTNFSTFNHRAVGPLFRASPPQLRVVRLRHRLEELPHDRRHTIRESARRQCRP